MLVARLLMADPSSSLFDEPCAGLDLGGRESLVAVLGELARRGRPLVMVTHHLEEIPPGFTHALLLRAGSVVAAGPIDETLTSAAVSATFGISVAVASDRGRWLGSRQPTACLTGLIRFERFVGRPMAQSRRDPPLACSPGSSTRVVPGGRALPFPQTNPPFRAARRGPNTERKPHAQASDAVRSTAVRRGDRGQRCCRGSVRCRAFTWSETGQAPCGAADRRCRAVPLPIGEDLQAEFDRQATAIQDYVKYIETFRSRSATTSCDVVGDYIVSVPQPRPRRRHLERASSSVYSNSNPGGFLVVHPPARERRQLRGLQLGRVRRGWCVPVHARHLELDRRVVGTVGPRRGGPGAGRSGRPGRDGGWRSTRSRAPLPGAAPADATDLARAAAAVRGSTTGPGLSAPLGRASSRPQQGCAGAAAVALSLP